MVKLPVWVKVLIFLSCWPSAVLAEPMIAAEKDGIRIVVYTEDCALKNIVTNLPKRATWTEKGKVYEGCAGPSPLGVVMFFFKEDKTVAVVPMDMFARVSSI